jgi:serine/threonine protein kinase
MRQRFEESARVVGESTKAKLDATADTVTSAPMPPRGEEPPTEVKGAIESRSGVVLGARASDRIILSAGSKGIGQCLVRHEVVAYLGPACPRDLRARVEAHIVDCLPCRRWIRHVDDEILEYIGGQRAEEELARMDAHLDACKVCRELMHHVVQSMAQSWHGDERGNGEASTTFVAGNIVNSRYLIRSFVGRGGMGEVYEAFDRLMDRRIALKTMLCTAADRPRAARRFKEEVRNAQRVGHPHVCRINDLQEHDEGVFGPPLPFFTMEYVDGDRLGNRLLEGPLSVEDARVIALQLLDGLRAAHQRGVLHLDFKSDNVMLRRNTETPDAVIMDFGLSRVLGGESKLRTSDRRQFAGTLPYMSVEQLECREDLGPATDMYAFGVVLYELLTRTLPFEGESLGAVLLKQLNERPKPPSRHVPELCPALDRFVLKCLKNDPRARYADAGQALIALEAIGPWSRSRTPKARRVKVATAMILIFVGALLLVTALREPSNLDAKPSTAVSTPGGRAAIEELTRALGSVPSAPANISRAVVPAASPASPAPAAATVDQPMVPSHRSLKRPTAGAPEHVRDAVGVDPPRASLPTTAIDQAGTVVEPGREPARTEPAGSAAPTAGLSGDDHSPWRPARVPKRLSVPIPRPPVIESADQNSRR